MTRHALIVEDIAAVRDWLVEVCKEVFPDHSAVTFGNLAAAQGFLDKFARDEHTLDLALVDLGLPDGSGTDLIRRLARDFPDTLPIVTTIYGDDAHIFEAIAAGARGYLLKDDPPETFKREFVRIRQGEPALSPAVARRMIDHFRMVGVPQRGVSLTNREMEVLSLLALGMRIQDIAREAGISEHTARDHVKSIYRKLNVSSRAEAAIEAVRRGLV